MPRGSLGRHNECRLLQTTNSVKSRPNKLPQLVLRWCQLVLLPSLKNVVMFLPRLSWKFPRVPGLFPTVTKTMVPVAVTTPQLHVEGFYYQLDRDVIFPAS